MLKIEDLNKILKYFTTQIYQRLLQLQNQTPPQKQPPQQQQHQQQNEQNAVQNIILKYCNYIITDDVEHEYVKKMTQRILQIFGFYKWKCRNQSILNHVERQLVNKFHLFLADGRVNVGRVMQFVVDVCRKGFVYKANAAVPMTKQSNTPNKSRRKFYTKTQTKQSRQATRQTNIIPTNTIQSFNNSQNMVNKKRRTSSVMCYNSSSIHPTAQLLQKLYPGMNIDKIYMSKIIQSENYLTRDQLKRNKSRIKKLHQIDQFHRQRISICNSTRKVHTEQRQRQRSRQREKEKEKEREREKEKEKEKEREYKQVLRDVKNNTKYTDMIWKDESMEMEQKGNGIAIMLQRKKCRVKTSCWRKRNKDRKSVNNQNSFI